MNGMVNEHLASATDAVAIAGAVTNFDIPANDPAVAIAPLKKRRCSLFLYIGGAGTLVFKTVGGATVTMPGLAAGTTLWVQASDLVAAGSTATNVTVFYGGV